MLHFAPKLFGHSSFNSEMWIVFLLIALWTLPWKAYALWKAARNEQQGWFIIILLFNTLAILEVFYIFVFADKKKKAKVVVEAVKDTKPSKKISKKPAKKKVVAKVISKKKKVKK
ncbi:MAG: hypothetical protein HQ536_01365 [Parcubacteria group bacterium]|nr:hypothetical protein [Parcubacteria group bacterium]